MAAVDSVVVNRTVSILEVSTSDSCQMTTVEEEVIRVQQAQMPVQ